MDHQKKKELISFYHEGELSAGEKRTVEEHLEHCAECRKEFAEMGEFEEVMRKMQLKKPQKEIWEAYWSTIYNRLNERLAGFFFRSVLLFCCFSAATRPSKGSSRIPHSRSC